MRYNPTLFISCCVAFVGLFACGCVMNKLDPSYHTILLKQQSSGTPITIAVTKGPVWSQRMQAGPFIFNILPQIVVWAETADGHFFKTLYITGADGNKFRHSTKNKKGAAFYTECFPVWAKAMNASGQTLPSKEKPYTDAVTSATPMSSFAVRSTLPAISETFVIYAEVNKSADTNSTYTKNNNDWAGQPSLIYKTIVEPGRSKAPLYMKLTGHGGRIFDKPAIYEDLSGFDTALKQVEEIVIRFE